ncbi:ATP-grasp domain-containing protein [Candidatus Microgenomates bacterium]|nr:ATP-grasp domain-containing protein [Candidatus Microgenomates bacterium]
MNKLNKKNCTYIGVFPRDVSSLMFTKWIPERKLLYLVVKNTTEEKWAKKFLNAKKIASYEVSPKKGYLTDKEFDDLLEDSNLSTVVKKYSINALLTTSRYTDLVKRWSEKNKIKIISHAYWKYKDFENKLWFDKFLDGHNLPKPISAIYKYPASTPIKGKLVLQKSNSSGGEGTYYIKNHSEIKKLIGLNEINTGEKYLLRQYISGKPYGITLFIAPGIATISAMRLQCFMNYPLTNKKIFVGIQWIPSNRLNADIKRRINGVFFKIGKIFYRQKFWGCFNIDFIVDRKDKFFLLECNPRFSAGTTQILKFPEVISDINIGKFFVENSVKPTSYNQQFKFFAYPNSTFRGSLLEIQLHPEISNSEITIKKEFNNGVYVYKNGNLRFKSSDIRMFSNKQKELIFYSDARRGEVYTKFTTIATIISNFPLFDFKGSLNKNGNKLFRKFKY